MTQLGTRSSRRLKALAGGVPRRSAPGPVERTRRGRPFFVAVFPGNIAQYSDGVDAFGLDTDTKRAVRLLFQPLLVAAALGATDALRTFRASRSAAAGS